MENTFEEKFKKLEEILNKLEQSSTSLEEACKLYEESKKLSAELKEILNKSLEKSGFIVQDGEIKPFTPIKEEKDI